MELWSGPGVALPRPKLRAHVHQDRAEQKTHMLKAGSPGNQGLNLFYGIILSILQNAIELNTELLSSEPAKSIMLNEINGAAGLVSLQAPSLWLIIKRESPTMANMWRIRIHHRLSTYFRYDIYKIYIFCFRLDRLNYLIYLRLASPGYIKWEQSRFSLYLPWLHFAWGWLWRRQYRFLMALERYEEAISAYDNALRLCGQ